MGDGYLKAFIWMPTLSDFIHRLTSVGVFFHKIYVREASYTVKFGGKNERLSWTQVTWLYKNNSHWWESLQLVSYKYSDDIVNKRVVRKL